ncbi:MAG: hypothetical protein Q9225_005366 [Loekoesia sp. 1 TL-2023]
MPLTPEDQLRVDEAEREAAAAGSAKFLSKDASESQKLGPFSVACTVLNRTIGIFVAPAIILKATNSSGVSLLLWSFGALVGISGLLVWLELGLSIPRFQVPDSGTEASAQEEGSYTSVPRSGGEKNYVGTRHNPRFMTTCVYGTLFIVFGNLCGNAVAFGIYVLQAANIQDNAPLTRGLAVVVLTAACVLHAVWRQGGILVNNALATLKVLILLSTIGIGFAAAAGAFFGNDSSRSASRIAEEADFNPHNSFANARGDLASYANAILFAIYPYIGFFQPFYVMSEVSQPKKNFAKTTLSTMIFVSVVYLLVNIAYLCVVSQGEELDGASEMATLFFRKVFGNSTAPRVMSAMIALSIFGNILIMTFTATKVKQEIAKEGVLPFSKFFAMSNITPFAWMKGQARLPSSSQEDERSPMPALLLHWVFTMLLIAATSSVAPSVAYQVLVSLYSYTIVALGGLLTAGGLLYLHWVKGREWTDNVGFRPWGGPAAAVLYSLVCAFLLISAFLPPSAKSPFADAERGYHWYIVPVVGLCSVVVGYLYYLVFAKLIPRWKQQMLIVERDPIIVRQDGKPNGEWVQILEIIDFWWTARDPDAKA